MKKFRTAGICFFLFALSGNAAAQNAADQIRKPDSIPLFKFLQKNFDSTVIWFPSDSYYHFDIVIKWENHSYYFTYQNPYRKFEGRHVPNALYWRFTRQNNLYYASLPDTNQFFLPKAVHYSIQNVVSDALMQNDIWALKDDRTDSSKCPDSGAMDVDTHRFILITKSSIRQLSFLEIENCPENINRQKARKIIEAFTSVFGQWY